jgi:hypothetical protein
MFQYWFSSISRSDPLLPKETLNGGFTVMVLVKDVLHWCETWSLTLREENRLEVFEYGVLRIFGLKWEG